MIKDSTVWRSFCAGWSLVCDRMLPRRFQPTQTRDAALAYDELNPLYFLPLLGAAAGLFMLITGKVLSLIFPLNGTAILFALITLAAGEMRTNGRALALNVTFFDNFFTGKNLFESRKSRVDSLRDTAGLIPLLLAIGMLGGKFMAVLLVARTGHFGVTALAMVAALSVEALLASEPDAVGVPSFCRHAKGEYLVIQAGFFVLFNLVFLPLATLIVVGAITLMTLTVMFIAVRRFREINSDDMTMTGYLLEFAVWLLMALLIG